LALGELDADQPWRRRAPGKTKVTFIEQRVVFRLAIHIFTLLSNVVAHLVQFESER
jgi:hypothetical protein